MHPSLANRVATLGKGLLSLLALLAVALPALAGEALLLDRGARSVSRMDTRTLDVRASVVLPEAPTRVVLSPDGATAVVLCRGEGDDKYDGFRAKTKSWAFLLDTATLKEKARVELGFGVGPAFWAAGGSRLVVLAQGYPHSNPEKRQVATVVSLDGQGKARSVALGRAAADMVVSPDGSVAAVLASRAEGASQVFFVDAAAGTAGEPVTLRGEVTELLLAPDGDTLYALARGKAKGFGNVPGSLAVFTLSGRRKVGELKLSAITAVGGFDRSGRLVLGGDRAGEVKEARLYVVKGAAVEYDVPGPTRPSGFRFAPDGRSAWAFGGTTAQIEFGDFSAAPVVSDLKIYSNASFERTPDGKRALVHESDGQGVSTVYVYDLETGKKVKSFDTASFGARLGAGLGAAAATLGSMESGRRDAQAHGRSSYTYSIYGPKTEVPRGRSIVVLPSGRVAYVYDPFGSTVLAFDLETLAKGKRQDAGEGSRGLYLTGGGKTLLLASSKGLNAYDATTFGEPLFTKTDGPADLVMGETEALLLAKGLVAVVDPASGKVGAKSTSFKDPAIGVLLP